MSIRLDNFKEFVTEMRGLSRDELDMADLVSNCDEVIGYCETLEEGLRGVLQIQAPNASNIKEFAAELVGHIQTYLDDNPNEIVGAGVPSDQAVALAEAAAERDRKLEEEKEQ